MQTREKKKREKLIKKISNRHLFFFLLFNASQQNSFMILFNHLIFSHTYFHWFLSYTKTILLNTDKYAVNKLFSFIITNTYTHTRLEFSKSQKCQQMKSIISMIIVNIHYDEVHLNNDIHYIVLMIIYHRFISTRMKFQNQLNLYQNQDNSIEYPRGYHPQ